MIKIQQGYYWFEIEKDLIQKGAKYALYQIDVKSNVIVKKYWYQESALFQLDLMSQYIEDFRFRVYIMDKEGNKRIENRDISELPCVDEDMTPGEFVGIISLKCERVLLITLLNKVIEADDFFAHCIRIKHGSYRVNSENLKAINEELRTILAEKIGIRTKNALKFLIYFLSKNDLISHKKLLLRKCDFLLSEQDLLFFKSVFYFRINDNLESKYYNEQLFKYKSDLAYHQQGAISYIDLDSVGISAENPQMGRNKKPIRLIDIQDINQSSVLLMSCDYGYFCAYADKTIENASLSGNLIHFHLIVSDESMLTTLDIDLYRNKNIGITYEVYREDESVNKTYYSIARYLILRDIIELYQRNIIVCDIDIELRDNIDYLSTSIAEQKIGLITNGGDLPWITYMAGFNFFGRKTKDSNFVIKLIMILKLLYESGRDLWTLDQVALLLAVESQEITGNIEILVDLKKNLKKSIKQYSDRHLYRGLAQKSLNSFQDKHSF